MTLTDFYEVYSLASSLRDLLENEGFSTAGALVNVTTDDCVDIQLQRGHIAELMRALQEFVAEKVN